MLPTLTGVGRVVADPELRVTSSGTAVASVRLAFNSRRKNEKTGEWEDGDTFWVRGTCWRDLAEHAAETLAKGMEVIVSGELRTESWEKDGQRQQAPALLIRSIGPSLAYATATVQRPDSNKPRTAPATAGRQQHTQTRQQDPWDVTSHPAPDAAPPF